MREENVEKQMLEELSALRNEVKKLNLPHNQLLDFYNGAAQYHATAMVAVVFGQFAVLTLLQGKGGHWQPSWPWSWPLWSTSCWVWSFAVIYLLIVGLGWYSLHNYLMFAHLLELLRSDDNMKDITSLDEKLRKRIGQPSEHWLRRSRGWLVTHGMLVEIPYLLISLLAVVAALSM